MRSRVPRRYLVRDAAGRELLVPSLQDLHRLYRHGFLSDHDQVRAESSNTWEPLGAMAALDGVRDQRREGVGRVIAAVVVLAALAAGLGMMLAR
jgi:hypothetical protein